MDNTVIYRAATIGMFDGVHRGHRHIIDQLCKVAKERDLTPTVFTFDRHPLTVIAPDKAPKSITTPARRSHLMIDGGVHDVFILVFNSHFRELSAKDFLKIMHDGYGVRALVVGFNHHFGHDSDASFDDYRRMGAEVGIEVLRSDELTMDSPEPLCSSTVRHYLEKGDIESANAMLGHHYTLYGKVERGNGIGRTIGFPTANVRPYSETQLIPATGVYEATAQLQNRDKYKAMVNIGTNPTVNKGEITKPRVEAHLIDFDGNLYGEPIELTFVRRIRDERKFDNVQQLAAQLERDRETVKNSAKSEPTKS